MALEPVAAGGECRCDCMVCADGLAVVGARLESPLYADGLVFYHGGMAHFWGRLCGIALCLPRRG